MHKKNLSFRLPETSYYKTRFYKSQTNTNIARCMNPIRNAFQIQGENPVSLLKEPKNRKFRDAYILAVFFYFLTGCLKIHLIHHEFQLCFKWDMLYKWSKIIFLFNVMSMFFYPTQFIILKKIPGIDTKEIGYPWKLCQEKYLFQWKVTNVLKKLSFFIKENFSHYKILLLSPFD